MFQGTIEKYGPSFIEDKIPLVVRIAGRIHRKLPACVVKDDLVSAGLIGLLDAAGKFDLSAGTGFDRYAEFRIRGAMLDELRKMDSVPRSTREKINQARRLCESSGETNEGSWGIKGMASFIESFVYNGDIEPDDCPSNEEDSFEILSREETKRSVAKMLDELSPNEKTVIFLIYYEELSMTRVAGIMGLSTGRISQIHKGVLSKLRKKHRKFLA